MNTLHLKSLIEEIRQSDERQRLEEEKSELKQQNLPEAQARLTEVDAELAVLQEQDDKRSLRGLQEIFVEYYPFIYKCLNDRSCPRDIIDDLAQNAAVRIQKSLRRNKFTSVSSGGFLSWIAVIVQRTWADHWSRRKRCLELQEVEIERQAVNDVRVGEPETFVDMELVQLIFPEALSRVFRQITSMTYRSVCLRIAQGLSPGETASELGLSSDVVDKQRSRFKLKLMREIEEIYREMNSGLSESIPNSKRFQSALSAVVEELFDTDDFQPLTVQVNSERLSRLQWLDNVLGESPLPASGCWLLACYNGVRRYELTETIPCGIRPGFREGRRLLLPFEEDSGMSGLHSTFERKGNDWLVRDEHSTNGIFVNGKKVDFAILNDRDIIQMGRVYMVFISEG